MKTAKLKHIKDFYSPVIAVLKGVGGGASIEKIYLDFWDKYSNQLDESCLTEIKDGDIKWRDYINRAGFQLVRKGYIRRVGRGVWVLTDKKYSQE